MSKGYLAQTWLDTMHSRVLEAVAVLDNSHDSFMCLHTFQRPAVACDPPLLVVVLQQSRKTLTLDVQSITANARTSDALFLIPCDPLKALPHPSCIPGTEAVNFCWRCWGMYRIKCRLYLEARSILDWRKLGCGT